MVMTEAEIMKAFGICANENGMCSECVYSDDYTNCNTRIAKDALDLINRKNAEIERLTNLDKLHDKITAYSIEEAIKEFVEKAKDTKFKVGNEYVIYADNIDQIAKEMGVEL